MTGERSEPSTFRAALEAFHKGQLPEAIEGFSAAIEERPKHALSHYMLARAFVGQSRFEEARRVVQGLLEGGDDKAEYHALLASFEDRDAAIESLKRAIALRNSIVAWQRKLATLLYQSGRLDEAAVALVPLCAAPDARPIDLVMLAQIRRGHDSFEQALVLLRRAIAGSSTPSPVWKALEVEWRAMGGDACDGWTLAVELHRASLPAQRKHDAIRRVAARYGLVEQLRTVLDDVMLGSHKHAALPDGLMALDREARVALYTLILDLCDPLDLHELPRDLNEAWSVDVPGLRLDRGAIHDLALQRTDQPRPAAFQLDLLTAGSFSMRSPLHGRLVVCNGSLVAVLGSGRPFVLYHFDDEEPFFSLAHPFSGALTAIYFPRRNVLVADQSMAAYRNALSQFRALIVEFASETAAHLRKGEPRPRALLYGAMNHVGHAVYNEYEGMHQASAAGHLEGVDVVVQAWSSFLPHRSMFPELAAKSVIPVGSMIEAYRAVVERRLMVVRPVVSKELYTSGLRERILRCARAESSAAARGAIDEAARRSPLIWVEIRTNDRCWSNQVDGVAAVANALADSHPNVGLVLAGWSRLPECVASGHDDRWIASDREVARRIREGVRPDIPVFDITGTAPPDKFLWSASIDFFVGALGSGLLFPLCTGHKPGVVHCTREYLRQVLDDHSRLSHAPGHRTIYVIDPDHVRKQAGNSYQTANYEIAWEHIHCGLKTLIASAEANEEKLRPSQ